MRSVWRNNASWVLSLVMIVSILWLGIFSVIAMDHTIGMHAGCPIDLIGENGPLQPMGFNFCTTTHMGMVQETSRAIPGSIDFGAGVVSLIALAFLLHTRVRDGDGDNPALWRLYHSDRSGRWVETFFYQILQWISLFEKRGPSHSLA